MKTRTQFGSDLRIRAGYGTAFILVVASFLLTICANSMLLRQARRVAYPGQPVSGDEIATMTARYNLLNDFIFVSLSIAVVVALSAWLTYARENRARRLADRQLAEHQRQLQERVRDLDRANQTLHEMRSVEKFAATGRIARTIAHEVRNPLTNINLAVEQLQTELEHGAAKNSSLLLNMIGRNSDRINGLITDLLNSTKFTDLKHQRIAVNDLLEETLALAEERIRMDNIIVTREYMTDRREVSVDIRRMKVAMLNVVANALDAMQPGLGILRLRTAVAGDKCVITISDNGSGIEEDALSKVFEPYFSDKPAGTGLGLTNTQNIVLNHNGSINLESKKGVGTTFTIQLALA
ncbi:MAG TPA: ATP-binding protein [Puia sp.]|nr:ATP-binding protein [Puia sp.]